MNKRTLIAVLSLAGLVGCASQKDKDCCKMPGKQGMSATQPSAMNTPVNTQCMVETKDKADPSVTYMYQGKTYAFCCKDCKETFAKDPEKYIAAAK